MTNEEFISIIGELIQQTAAVRGYAVPSAIIAQACLESAYGRSTLASVYHNYFGLKCGSGWTGKAVRLSTKEEYMPGTLTKIVDAFRVYDNMADGVAGYFDFIKYPRYANLRTATTPHEYLSMIKADGYATSSSYVTNCMAIVNRYNLTRFDNQPTVVPTVYAAIVNASALRVRSSHSLDSPVVQLCGHDLLLPKGMCVAVDAECSGFARLSGCGGWVSKTYLLH